MSRQAGGMTIRSEIKSTVKGIEEYWAKDIETYDKIGYTILVAVPLGALSVAMVAGSELAGRLKGVLPNDER